MLAGIADRVARKVISARKWRGVESLVREVEIGRGGAGGKALQVHVDTLPADLREAWCAQHGIKLHEKVDPETGEVRHVPDESFQHGADFKERHRLAEWRRDLILPVSRLPKGSVERAALIKKLAEVQHRFPNGDRKAVTPQTIYNWLNHHQLKLVGLKKWRIGNPPFQHEHAPHARLNLINRLENGGFKPHHGK